MNMGALISISGCWRLVLKARLNDIVSVLFAVMMSILKRGTTVEYRVGNFGNKAPRFHKRIGPDGSRECGRG